MLCTNQYLGIIVYFTNIQTDRKLDIHYKKKKQTNKNEIKTHTTKKPWVRNRNKQQRNYFIFLLAVYRLYHMSHGVAQISRE